MHSPSVQLFLVSIFFWFLLIQTSVCPDPDENTNLYSDEALLEQTDTPNEPKRFVNISDQVFENWALENERRLNAIATQIDRIHALVGPHQCPVGPDPFVPPDNPDNPNADTPRCSLSFIVRTLEASLASFEGDVATMSKSSGNFLLGNIIRENLGWKREQVESRSEAILDTLRLGILQMKDLWEGYNRIGEEIRKHWIQLPKHTLKRRLFFLALWLTDPEQNEDGSPDRISIDLDSIKKKMARFERHLRWMSHAVTVGQEWADLAETSQLNHPVYTQMLDREKFDPNYGNLGFEPELNGQGIPVQFYGEDDASPGGLLKKEVKQSYSPDSIDVQDTFAQQPKGEFEEELPGLGTSRNANVNRGRVKLDPWKVEEQE
ncbi:hypothetical protein TWF281_003006 [Arthrobotrys megalospora]